MSYTFWKFVIRDSYGPGLAGVPSLKNITLNWFVPPLSPGSGGHINIFRFVIGLQKRGFYSRIVINNDAVEPSVQSSNELKIKAREWYGPFEGEIVYRDDQVPCAHASIATGWQTAYAVKQFNGSPLKLYFIQDFEPDFMAVGSEYYFAKNTYGFGFVGITAGKWLANLLKTEYGMETHALSFAYDRLLYRQTPRRDEYTRRLFVYVRRETPRRGYELTILALSLFNKEHPDVEILMAGGHVDASTLPFKCAAFGSLAQSELPDLYSQVDCALVLSLTNLSLLPLELMACGVHVVCNRGDNVTWLLDDKVVSLCEPKPESIASALSGFFSKTPEERQAMREQAKAFAERTDWAREFDKLAAILRRKIGAGGKTPTVTSEPRQITLQLDSQFKLY